MDPEIDWRSAVPAFLEIVARLQQGDYEITGYDWPAGEVGSLGEALIELAEMLQRRESQAEKLHLMIERLNAGFLLEEVLDRMYAEFREFIPYNRIGLSLIQPDSETVTAVWVKSDLSELQISPGYSAPLKGSSLQTIIDTGEPRILNDLVDYLRRYPDSDSTRRIVEEGIRSSLTCPLIADGEPVGFLFFSSTEPNAYADAHIELFHQIASGLSVAVEKARLVSLLSEQAETLERQNEALRRQNELRNRILGIAAHDLRAPLSFILTSSDLLLGPDAEVYQDAAPELLESIRRQAKHLSVLIEDVLDFVEIEASGLKLMPTFFDLDHFLERLVLEYSQAAAAKDSRVVLEDVTPGKIFADPDRLRQVVDNLVSNALKYSPSGSLIRVSACRKKSYWQVRVQDQGPGIRPEDRSLLFQPFSRLSARPTGNEKSTGLGLSISRSIVEAHGGQIDVDSHPGEGCIFWFTIPDEEIF